MNNSEQWSHLNKIRRLEKIVAVLSILIIALIMHAFFLTTQQTGITQAHGFQLLNERSQIMAGLEFNNGFPQLYLMDDAGQKRLVATHDTEGTQIFLKDDQGTTRVGIAQFSHGGGGFALHGEHSKGAAVLYFKETGSLRFFDPDGKVTKQVLATASDKNN